jgi:hypothetical protein
METKNLQKLSGTVLYWKPLHRGRRSVVKVFSSTEEKAVEKQRMSDSTSPESYSWSLILIVSSVRAMLTLYCVP